MLVEWELTLDCQNKCHYCTNGNNCVILKAIKCETREEILYDFMVQLNKKYPNINIFLFGGEPSLHPRFEFILQTLNNLKQPYTIQTNFQNPKLYKFLETMQNSTKVEDLQKFRNIQVSVHRTQIRNINSYFKKLLEYKNFIKRIDIMYTNIYDEKLYDKWHRFFSNSPVSSTREELCSIQLTPFSYFGTPYFSNDTLKSKILKSLTDYCEVHRLRSHKCEKSYRCYFWVDMLEGRISTKGKECLYYEDYVLYDPSLKQYNCSHRLNTKICPNESCFLMDFNNQIIQKLTK